MDEKTFEGKIEDMAVKPKKPEGEFVKLKVNGRTFNFFDMGYYEEHKARFKLGADVSIVYVDSTFTNDEGKTITTHTANAIAFTSVKADAKTFMPDKQKDVTEFKKAAEVPKAEPAQEDDIETMMNTCLRIAVDATDKWKDEDGNCLFTSDNVTSICNSMFIESCKRRR